MSEPTSKPLSPELQRLLIHGREKPNGLTLPPHYGPAESWNPAWADRMALTAAWVIEHGGYFDRPTPVQSAIVFRESRPDWRIDPEGDHLAIQVIRGPRKINTYRWRICDGMQIADSGSEFRNQDLRLPDLSSHVGPGVPSEVALLCALDAAGFVKVAVGESGRPVVATPPEGGSHAESESDRRGP